MKHILLTLVLVLAGYAPPSPAQGNDSISGTIRLDSGDAYGVERSPLFDPQAIKARADKAYAQEQYEEAFGDYLAICGEDYPESCYRAASMFDARLLGDKPAGFYDGALADHLYETACMGGIAVACKRADSE